MKPNALLVTLLVATAALLAGCNAPAQVDSRIVIDYNGAHEDVDAIVHATTSTRTAKDMYVDFPHPDFYSAHDQLVKWADRTGTVVQFEAFSNPAGYYVSRIAGYPLDTNSAYWSLSIQRDGQENATTALVGMGDLEVKDGDAIHWELITLQVDTQASGEFAAGGIVLATPPPSADERVTLTGDGPAGPATLRVTHGPEGAAVVAESQVEIGPGFALDVVLPFPGHNTIEVFTDSGAFGSTVAIRLATYTMEVNYGPDLSREPTSHVVTMDPDLPAALGAYDGKPRPAFAIVHDVMAAWEAQTASTIEYSYSDSFGYGVNKVNGAGNPLTASLPPWWCYEQNGETADLGISLQPVAPGDVVSWTLGTCTGG